MDKGPVNLSTSKVISDTFFVSAARIGMTVLKPIRGILLGRLLGPSLYGILIIPVPYIQILTMLSNIGFNTAVVKLIPEYRQKGMPELARMIYRSTVFITIILSIFWSVLLLLLSGWIATDLSHRPDAVGPIRIYALIIPFLALNTFYAVVFLAMQRGKLKAGLSVVYGIINLLLPIFAVLWREDVIVVLGAFLAAEIIGAAIYAFYFHRNVLLEIPGKAASLFRGVREVFGFGFLFFFAALGWNVINSVDRIMVKYYLPVEQLSFYAMAALVITALNIISSTAGTALIPSLTAARNDGDTLLFRRQIWNTARLGLLILIPMAGILYTLASDIYMIVLPKYIASAPVLRIMVFIGILDVLCRISWASLVAHGRGGKAASAYIIAALMNFFLNRMLIPRFGIEGAAAATVASFVILAAVLQVMMSVVSGVRIRAADFFKPFLVALVFPLIGYLLHGAGSYPRIVAVLCAGALFYLLISVATGIIRGEDLTKVRYILENRPESSINRAAIRIVGLFERISR